MEASKKTFVLRNAVDFGFHSIYADNIKISEDGMLAEKTKLYGCGVVYGAKVLRGTTEFEVEITSCKTKWAGSLTLGVMQCVKGTKIKHSAIPQISLGAEMYCMWSSQRVLNKLVGYLGPTEKKYGSTNLENLREGDRLGLRVTHDGVLTFFVNGKSQGVAAQGVYQDGYDLYPVVDVYANCKAVRITRAVQKIDGSATYQERALKEEVAILREQLRVYQEDFEAERHDRQRMNDEKLHRVAEIAKLQQERDGYKKQVSLLTQQLAEKDNLLKTTEAVQLQLRQQIAEKDQFIESLQKGFGQQKDQFIQIVRSEKEGLRQQIAEKDGLIQSLQSEKEGLKQQIAEKDQFIESLQEGFRQQKDQFIQIVRSEKEGLRQQIAEKDRCIQSLQNDKEGLRQQIAEKDQLIQSLESDKEGLRQQVAEKDQLIQSLESDQDELRQQVAEKDRFIQGVQSENAPQPHPEQSYQSKFWEVPREEVSLNMQKILGTGAWGFVVEGTFRGQQVAVKCLHDMIQEPEFVEVIRKELDIMAQIRHPNLVMLIAAVIDAENDPLVVTELLDTSLRKAYERNLLEGSSKLNIFRDIASALNYLHLHHHGEIVHRDVSSANVLLEAKPNNQWKAKLSDFGSAKLAMEAKTKGPGAPVYAAPEVRRETGISQTAKVDVYSYGILLCEVTMGQFPMEKRLPNMLEAVRDRWVFIHGLITACIQEHPDNRPTMSYLLAQLNKPHPN